MSARTLEVIWPIEDTRAPLADLKAEALADVDVTLTREGLTYASHPQLEVLHGNPAHLRCTVRVRPQEKL